MYEDRESTDRDLSESSDLESIMLEVDDSSSLDDSDSDVMDGDNAQECVVCMGKLTTRQRPCCDQPVCKTCMTLYVAVEVNRANIHIQCPVAECKAIVDEIELLSLLPPQLVDLRETQLISQLCTAYRKSCPGCNHVIEMKQKPKRRRRDVDAETMVTCPSCELEWCFPCWTPWTQGHSCKDWRAEDERMNVWAASFTPNSSQRNARHCPNCKAFIQRSDGCSHMSCTQCQTNFCYDCGRRLSETLPIGRMLGEHHDSKFGVLGCPGLIKNPALRVVSRGGIFGLKLLVIGAAVPLAASVAMAASTVAVPVYVGYRVTKSIERRRGSAALLRRSANFTHTVELRSYVRRTFSDIEA